MSVDVSLILRAVFVRFASVVVVQAQRPNVGRSRTRQAGALASMTCLRVGTQPLGRRRKTPENWEWLWLVLGDEAISRCWRNSTLKRAAAFLCRIRRCCCNGIRCSSKARENCFFFFFFFFSLFSFCTFLLMRVFCSLGLPAHPPLSPWTDCYLQRALCL